jgi:amino acid adenylation domain-containing protein
MLSFLDDIITESAGQYPDETALIEGGRAISYKRLLATSNHIGSLLLDIGAGAGSVVVVYLPKSIEAVISPIAVSMIGAIYVPLDTGTTPPVRFSLIAKKARASVVIALRSDWDKISAECDFDAANPQVLFADDFLDEALGNPLVELPMLEREPDDLAYILFTSGSTGAPKGVKISHRNAMSFVTWAAEFFPIRPKMRFSSIASLGFDLSVFDVYVSLSTGGELYIVPPDVVSFPRALAKFLTNNRIECIYSVPSVWLSLMQYGEPEFSSISSLELILYAGELFPDAHLKHLMTSQREARFFNLYGPTETNVCSVHEIRRESELDSRIIGKPCADCHFYLLDDNLNPVDDGEVANLFVGGPSISPGYVGDRDGSDRAFIRVPQPHGDSLYLHRTGDLASRTLTGEYVFHGRADNLVKLSGFRIELEEVELALTSVGSVLEAVALHYSNSDGNPSLGALITHVGGFAEAGGPDFALVARMRLVEFVPRYMIPNAIIAVSALPKNSNGKVDRAACSKLFSELIEN